MTEFRKDVDFVFCIDNGFRFRNVDTDDFTCNVLSGDTVLRQEYLTLDWKSSGRGDTFAVPPCPTSRL